MMGLSVGIDVHKWQVTVAIGAEPPFVVERTRSRLRWLARRLQARQPAIIVLEPSGGYERLVLEVLQAAELPVARVAPQQVRWFARSVGIAAKSDPLDARVLARFGQDRPPRLLPAPSADQQRLAALSAARRTLRDDLIAKQHQLAEQPAEVQTIYARLVAVLKAELAQIEQTMATLIARLPGHAHRHQVLVSCPGIGATTAALLLAELPELGQHSAKEVARLVGVAPLTQQSGAAPGQAHIDGGRRQVRSGLWLATLSAIRYNPVIQAFHARLLAAGKPPKVRRIACMRKLLTLLTAMLQHDQPWHHETVTP